MADLSPGDGYHWFAVLPDCAAARAAAQSLASQATDVVCHPSGRPWLVGRLPPETATVTVGTSALAIVGRCAAGDAELAALAGAGRSATELCEAADRLPGSHYLIASIDGQVVVRGTASGLRRVFYATVQGVPVAADRAQTLAAAIGARPDAARIAAALLAPSVPFPLDTSSLWEGVSAVRPDHCLVVTGDGSAGVQRWWTAPEPSLPVSEGAPAVREALRSAVALRASGPISADLSGGLDSTSLSFLASEQGASLFTLRVAAIDPASDDPFWARYAAEQLRAEHLVVSPTAVFESAAGLDKPVGDAEEPAGGLLTHALVGHTSRLLAEHGSRLHLAGYGGDEVFMVSRAYLRDRLRQQPRQIFAHLRAHKALRRWTWPAVVRELTADRSFAGWLNTTAAALRSPRLPEGTPQFGWSPAVRLPSWTTPEAAALVRELLLAHGSSTAPLAPAAAQHRAVTTIWSGAQSARQVGRIMAGAGIRLDTPFLDDTVLRAALAVDLAERGNPWRYKPLLTEAMAPVLPAALLERRTKAVFAADGMTGLRSLRETFVQLCDDPVLARLGLVDADALRAACVGLDPTGRTLMALEATMAMELWLRQKEGAIR